MISCYERYKLKIQSPAGKIVTLIYRAKEIVTAGGLLNFTKKSM